MEQEGNHTPRIDRTLTKDNWADPLEGLDWAQYTTAYGEAGSVKSQLLRLRSLNEEEALSATHDLWCGLCHQHVQIGSASLPAI